jgi:hypothetical protein
LVDNATARGIGEPYKEAAELVAYTATHDEDVLSEEGRKA